MAFLFKELEDYNVIILVKPSISVIKLSMSVMIVIFVLTNSITRISVILN